MWARNKYTYFASQAREEGYIQISAIFEETANQEKEHAKREFKFLQGGAIASTIDNLEAAASRTILICDHKYGSEAKFFVVAPDETSPSHKLMIHDWELMEAYRRWRHKYTDEPLLPDKIREKWLDTLCASTKDTYFYVGNIWRHPKQFMVLGVFYPPKSQPSLFGQ